MTPEELRAAAPKYEKALELAQQLDHPWDQKCGGRVLHVCVKSDVSREFVSVMKVSGPLLNSLIAATEAEIAKL